MTKGSSSSFAAPSAQVHEATGMIIVEAGVGAVEAAVLLVDYAVATDRNVQDTALDVVAGRLRLDQRAR